jgi:hypothetical protein
MFAIEVIRLVFITQKDSSSRWQIQSLTAGSCVVIRVLEYLENRASLFKISLLVKMNSRNCSLRSTRSSREGLQCGAGLDSSGGRPMVCTPHLKTNFRFR